MTAGAVPLLALTEKVDAPAPVGTPVMRPAVLSWSPAGRFPAVMANVGAGVPEAVTGNE